MTCDPCKDTDTLAIVLERALRLPCGADRERELRLLGYRVQIVGARAKMSVIEAETIVKQLKIAVAEIAELEKCLMKDMEGLIAANTAVAEAVTATDESDDTEDESNPPAPPGAATPQRGSER